MKLARTLTLVGLGFGSAFAIAAGQGCSSTATPAGTSSLGRPPQKPADAPTPSKSEHNYAVKTLLLGDTDRNLTASTTAWKKFGFNIDGKVSTKDSTDVCTPAKGAGKDAQVDGDNGIDNAFGSRIVPIIQTFQHEITKTISDTIAKGSFTIMIDTVGLTDDAKQTNTGLTGQLYAGAKFKGTPMFAIGESWPVSPSLLADGKTLVGGSKVKFGDAFVVNGAWVNGAASDVTLSLGFGDVSLDLTVHQSTIVFEHAGSTAANGTIAGVLDTEQFIAGLRKVVSRFSTSFCTGDGFNSIAQQIRQASDILSNGTNAAGSDCNGISIGVGFTAAEIAPPKDVADLGAPTPDMCADGGTPVSDDGGAPVDSGTVPVDSGAPPRDGSAG